MQCICHCNRSTSFLHSSSVYPTPKSYAFQCFSVCETSPKVPCFVDAYMFPEPNQLIIPNCIWIGSSVLAQHTAKRPYTLHHHHHNRFTAFFPGPPEWAGARRELLAFMVQGEINRGRHTDHPAGRHSIRTNQCPPPPSPHIFALPAAQPTVSNHWRQLAHSD